jgi:hypothetical protein
MNTARKASLLAIVTTLAACAGPQQDPYCTKREQVAATVNGKPHLVDGGCIEWTLGPSRRQVEAFDRRNGGAR